ncbi:MAG: hypothetical protein R3305_11975, partial [Gammaproteobacteria bacterium]|nr:hypothetical protein [Gammaproteobacteria bacterium]
VAALFERLPAEAVATIRRTVPRGTTRDSSLAPMLALVDPSVIVRRLCEESLPRALEQGGL